MATQNPIPEDVALSLALAVIAASPSPLLLLDGDLGIVAASASFIEAFSIAETELVGQSLYALSGGTWDIPELRRLLNATASGGRRSDDCELNLGLQLGPAKRLVVQARLLDYLDLDQKRILITVSDVTEARADAVLRDEEARHNTILLHEVRHRVANSLQIIASLLIQNAREAPSEETRGHLKHAHHRVMSVAALERLLSTSEEGDIQVHAYLSSLRDNITASMIREADNVTLTVDGGDGVIDARLSVSLGLIITELVINALKFAFPDGRPGRISVEYRSEGPNWTLCVRDDGVGMPAVGLPSTGLGTSVVLALAGQLKASVTTVPGHPGTKVTVEHTQVALVPEHRETAPKPFATQLA